MNSARFMLLGIVTVALTISGVEARASGPLYKLIKTVPLGGAVKWDYVHFDPATDRVYVSHATELTVLDAKTGAVAGHVTGLRGSHGIAIDAGAGLGYADSALNESTVIFDLKTLRAVKTIPALMDADGMVYDAASDQVFVVGGDAKAVLAVNAKVNEPATTIGLGGAPEFLVSDGAGGIYININDKSEIVKIDSRTDKIVARWPTGPCAKPVGLAIDPTTRRLFASCENAVMVVVNADSGKILAALPIGKGSDSAAFDPHRKLAFSANRDGTLSIIREVDPETFAVLPTVNTALGARTLAVDPGTGRVFLVTATVTKVIPPTNPGDRLRYLFAPNSLELLVFAPAAP